jgi:hypothetical protein
MDPLLDAFAAASQDDAEEQLGVLLAAHAAPLIGRVIAGRLGAGSSDADDVRAQVLLQLMLRLRHGRIEHTLGTIDAFSAYVAAATQHACDHFFRAKYPLRWQLRNRLRYALEHDRRFALWKSPHGTWLGGLRGWASRLLGTPPPSEALSDIAPQQVKGLLARLFDQSGGPLELTTIVDLAAEVWRVPRFPHDQSSDLEHLPDPARTADAALVQRERAERAWEEIRGLPARQRQALLLNLKDDALSLFLVTGTASLRALAEALDIDVAALAGLWNELPLSDNNIALRLGCTRQQVINLRMAARKRLVNRLDGRANMASARASLWTMNAAT